MTHSKAVMILDQLVPSINSSGDPAGVFVKYARDNNLAPAELERLCQLFNTAKSITHMQKSASRGSNYMVLPVEDIVADYTTYKAPKKDSITKSAATSLDYDPYAVPDVHKYLDNGGELFTKSAGDDLRWDEDAFQTLLKMANEQEAKEKQLEEEMFLETVKDLHDTTIRQSWKLMDKIAMQVTKDEQLIAKLERDSLSVEGHNKKAFDTLGAWMEKYHSATPVVRFDMTKAASVRLTRDTTGMLSTIGELTSMLNIIEDCAEFIKMAAITLDDTPELQDFFDELVALSNHPDTDREQYIKDLPSIIRPQMEHYPDFSTKFWVNKLKSLGALSESEAEKAFKLFREAETSAEAGKDKKGKKEPPTPYTDYGAFASVKEEDKNKDGHPLVKQLDTVVKNVGDASGESLNWLKDKLTSPNSFDKRRYQLDATRDSVRNALNLQRAIVTDPILSEADPSRLVSLYNSLSAANPEVMSDPNLLTYTLREAMQYDGVAPHTYEQLVGIDKSKSEAVKNRNTAIDTEYKIN